MCRPLIAATSLGLVLVLGSPTGCLGQAETEPEEATQEISSADIGVAVEPDAAPSLETENGGAIAVGDVGENSQLTMDSADPVVDMGDEMLVAPVPDGAVSDPEGEGPELAPPEEQPSGLTEPVVAPQPDLAVAPQTEAVQAVMPAAAAAPSAGASMPAQAPVAPSGESVVIAQGLVDIAPEEVVWRTVRYHAGALQAAPSIEWSLGFVVALDDPLLLVDQVSGERMLLPSGAAKFVPAGAVQQRASQSDARIDYLAIELVAASSAEDPENGDVLDVSKPFVPSTGHRALVLARHELPRGRVLAVPDTGERNLLLVLEGAVVAQATDGARESPLVAGESTLFRGAYEVTTMKREGTEASSQDPATILIASTGVA